MQTKTDICISLCDKTGIMMTPWAEAGYTCYCVDLQHPVRKAKTVKVGLGQIIYTYGDARYWTPPDNTRTIFMACFPVCTDMAGSGAQDYSNLNGIPKKGIPQLMDGLMLFNSCFQVAKYSAAPFCVENPVGIIPTHFRKADYYFHPWNYGDLYRKYTCLWTGGGFVMPEFLYTEEPEGVTSKIHRMSPGDDRANQRSETPERFARAVFEANKPKIVCPTH